MSIILTSLTRKDGLPLCLENDRTFDFRPDTVRPVVQALVKRADCPERQSIDAHGNTIHTLMGEDVLYLTVTSKGFPTVVAFTYLDELAQEFSSQHSASLHTVDRPFAFNRFDSTIRKTRKHFAEAAKSEDSDLTKMKGAVAALKDLVRANIDDVLQRGENLSALSDAGAALAAQSRTYQRDAERMERYAKLQKLAPIAVAGVLVSLLIVYALWRVMQLATGVR